MIDRASVSPTIEYSLENSNRDATGKFAIRLTNLTLDRSFDDIEVIVTAVDRMRILSAEITPTEPTFEGNVAPTATDKSAEFHLQRFMPGASATLMTTYQGGAQPRFRATAANGPVRFLERGLETMFIQNEIIVFLGIAGLALICIIVILLGSAFSGRRKPRREEEAA